MLIAATGDLRHGIGRAVTWARSAGSSHVEVARSGDTEVALASSGGNAARMWVVGSTISASLGIDRIRQASGLRSGVVPAGTIAVVATGEETLVASGDGNQRMFVHHGSRGSVASSHVGAIKAALGSESRLDRSYEDFLLGFGFLPDNRTPIQGVYAIERPSVYVLQTGEQVRVGRTSSPQVREAATPSDLAQVVCEIVDEQADGASDVGVLLGGFDSALVAAALRRTGRRIRTFTFAFREPGFMQHNIDAAVAASNAEHHWVHFSPEIIGRALEEFPAYVNQPSPQPHYQLQTIIAAEAAREAGCEVLFTGDGCDALFAAYPTVNSRAAAVQSLGRTPRVLRAALLSLLALTNVEDMLGHVARAGRSALRASLLPAPASGHLATQYLDDVALRRLRLDAAPAQSEGIPVIRQRLAAAVPSSGAARIAVHGNALTGQSQSKAEGALARSGLAIHSPYTHPRFAAAVEALPEFSRQPSGRLRGAEGKPALQHAAATSGLLPNQVIFQRKQSPTLSPIDVWYAGPLRSTILRMLGSLPFEVNLDYVSSILRPKFAEQVYRERATISRHAFQAVGLLATYSAITRGRR